VSQPALLILGGTAAYFLPLVELLGPLRRVDLTTPYGPAFPIFLLERYDERIAFASRHGLGRLEVSPPFVNARANVWAAHALGVTRILSWNGVGAINPLLEVHDLLTLDGLLDFTKTRVRSFGDLPRRDAADRERAIVESCFDPQLAAALHSAAQDSGRVFNRGNYACSEGPRLETAAEIRGFRRAGADVVGMTLVPEVFLARELGLAYAALAYVTNYATGHEPAHGAQRFFGVEVGKRCLAITRAAAEQYL
jgi:5'-methylthioadenosine phosphorylase